LRSGGAKPQEVPSVTFTSALHGSLYVIALAFIIGGIVMLAVERLRPAPVVMRADDTPIGRAVGVGVFQAAALVPGELSITK
jgi:undecaprenyl pyrophosphate phosphatase UppP